MPRDVPPYTGPRATGPYRKERPGRATLWIVTIHGPDGRRTDASYQDEAEAIRVRDDFNAANRREEASTVEHAVTAYLDHKRAVDGCKERTLVTTEGRLKNMLGALYDVPVDRVTRTQAAKIYERRYTEVSTDTHRNELAETRRFFAWAKKRRYTRGNPFEDVEPVGKRNTHKPQLHADEARKFMAHAFAVADGVPDRRANTWDAAHARGALGALCALLLAMRAGEIVGLRVRDVDDEGRLLWVAEEDKHAKTKSARRPIRVPDMLAERLLALAGGRDGSEYLWGSLHTTRWPLRAVERLCKGSGVPRVTAHGLRGTLSTLATAAGVGLLDLAKLLGHADAGTTAQRHYIAPGTSSTAARERGFAVLQGGKRGA